MDYRESITIVSGYKRSGTSLMMKLVQELGVPPHYDDKFEDYLKNDYGAENPYFYEDKDLVHKGFGAEFAPKLVGKVVKIFTYGLENIPPKEIPRCKIIVMCRNKKCVEASIGVYKQEAKKGHLTLQDDLCNLAQLDHHVVAKQYGGHIVDYDELCDNPEKTIPLLANYLGIKDYDLGAAVTIVNPKLRHHTSPKNNSTSSATLTPRATTTMLCAGIWVVLLHVLSVMCHGLERVCTSVARPFLTELVHTFLAFWVFLFELTYQGLSYISLRLYTTKNVSPVEPGDCTDAVLSVIIPVYNEEDGIGRVLRRLLKSAVDLNRLEVVIVDAGSIDKTMERVDRVRAEAKCETVEAKKEFIKQAKATSGSIGSASSNVYVQRNSGLRIMTVNAPGGGRGSTIAAGVAAASGSMLLLLHADCLAPPRFDRLVRNALASTGVVGAAFQFKVDRNTLGSSPLAGLMVMELAVGIRSSMFEFPWGDQGIALRREQYDRLGGQKKMEKYPIMEDLTLVQNLRQLGIKGGGQIKILEAPMLCSGRRWRRTGIWRATLLNQILIEWYEQGATAQQIFDYYYSDTAGEAGVMPSWISRLIRIIDLSP
jgi:glycosyltransferase involved in cell wall biosynthesis